MNCEDGQVYSVCILQFSCFTKYNRVCSQNINKQNVNIADETLSRYHYTKSKNYIKRRYRIRHWIPMFIGTPCRGSNLTKQSCCSENSTFLTVLIFLENLEYFMSIVQRSFPKFDFKDLFSEAANLENKY